MVNQLNNQLRENTSIFKLVGKCFEHRRWTTIKCLSAYLSHKKNNKKSQKHVFISWFMISCNISHCNCRRRKQLPQLSKHHSRQKLIKRNSRSWNWPYNMKLAQWAVFFFKVIVGKRQGSASSEKRAREGTREKIKHRSTCCSASKSNPLSQPITSNYSV